MRYIVRPGTNFDFVGKRYMWLAVSIVLVLASIVLIFTKGLNYGIDFTGGAEIQLKVPPTWDIGKLRGELEKGEIGGLKVQQIGDPEEHQFLVKVQGDESSLNQVSQRVTGILDKTLKPGEYEVQRADVVGPAAGSALRMSGYLSMMYALLCILIYVTIRFDFRYSPGAVLALFHDCIITLGVFVILQKPFDLQILAAILAIIGYSINDTIIVFDRVRESLQLNPGLKIEDAVNKSVNETLGRTILTSLTTFMTVFTLYSLGGAVIRDFAFALLVGIVVGVYSTVFIAGTMVIGMTKYYDKKNGRSKVQRVNRPATT